MAQKPRRTVEKPRPPVHPPTLPPSTRAERIRVLAVWGYAAFYGTFCEELMEEPTLAAQNALDDTLSDYETQKLNQILTLNEGQRDALCAAFQNIRSRANCPNPPCPDPPGA